MSRFIPAGAGNTGTGSHTHPHTPVYPRWRGEHIHISAVMNRYSGLSPLARGTRHAPTFLNFLNRFIPAGAGNTFVTFDTESAKSVYPRWRGEHRRTFYGTHSQAGLSPLARGTLSQVLRPAQVARFIPAGAGNTMARTYSTDGVTVYPRWRGEHSKHNLLLINDFLSQSQSTNFTVSHKQHIHYVKEHLIH
ncbi:hypothetical protein RG28_07700 [Escherichia coli]|nr:hypothetical protein RG28_07700 [Escherichia coli]